MFGTYRTILALMVVALHLGGVPVIGAYAVFGFYTLSGFLMTLIMHRNYGYSFSGLLRYGLNRFLRIYPIYWVSILISVFLILSLGEQRLVQYHGAIRLPSDIPEFLRNLFLFFPFIETPRLTPPAWALTVELFYYICIGLGFSITRATTWTWFGLSLLYHILVNLVGAETPLKYSAIPAASLPFSTGALIYHYRASSNSQVCKKRIMHQEYFPVLGLALMLANWAIGVMMNKSWGLYFYSNYAINAFMVFILCERRSLPLINKGFDKQMGDLSYPIYLIHYQVGFVVLILLGLFGYQITRPNSVLLIAAILPIFIASWVLTKAIERPIEKLRSNIKQTNPSTG